MATTVLNDIPEKITAGDSVAWRKSFSDYPADVGWTLSYALTKSDCQIVFTGSADGSEHLINLAATITADWNPGDYGFQAYVTKSGERYQVDEGLITIRPNLAAATDGYQSLPFCFKLRDAIEALLDNRATESHMSIAVGGRQISEMSHADLRNELTEAKKQCNNWLRKNRRDRGKPTGAQIKAAFTD